MQTYGSSVVPMIEANYEMFTVVEKTIADFFISNEKEMDFSSGRMAKMLHVSEASLSRFAKKMGYSGYREFIYNYQPSIAERPNVEEQTIHVLYSYEELLQKTYSLIREPQIKAGTVTPTSVRAAATIITILPIICIYPFLQKYFVTGLTLGGVKE